ncbi:MAG: hypothetical protein ACRD1B_04765 [Thermoanaerobaculia bacterium]
MRVLLVAALLCAALPARGQFVQLSRCRAALPCALPFGIRYNPDPLIAAQYGRVSTTAVSARLEPGWPIQTPVIDLSRVIESQDFAREAARLFVLRYPAPKTTPAPPAAPAGAPEPPRQP